jgi:hypothetical protein
MFEDRRIEAGVNLDGTLFGPVVNAGLDRPFMLVAAEGHGRDTDESWAKFWANLLGWRLNLQLTGSAHNSFTDFQVLIPQAAGVLNLPPDAVRQAIGTIDPHRSITTSAPTSPRSSPCTFVTATTTCSTAPPAASPKCDSCPNAVITYAHRFLIMRRAGSRSAQRWPFSLRFGRVLGVGRRAGFVGTRNGVYFGSRCRLILLLLSAFSAFMCGSLVLSGPAQRPSGYRVGAACGTQSFTGVCAPVTDMTRE